MNRPGSSAPRRSTGFTLVEVLVALAVVALALGALIRTTGQAADTQYEAEQRTLALWVASNRLAELSLAAGLEAGRSSGRTRMGGRDWRWQTDISAAPGGELWRIDVTVAGTALGEGRNATVAVHTGYLPR
ncbi:type II secretion system minor pseudopilin GspI [Wenzhouxiangella sp. XN79A]|uniref:type II secretion system minor pseudopilin GspI n=1 Tax=Wenzhouxiangella sp. XN79A TaxID=2724193 RepID=UPI00144AF4F0|nr:type II secretion system minor pseudopilin GspI [Wenzhouxiangella sp. XN79A]NKI35669.1 type II secretion system minor pseudopilin GspI [Wenzhouxiangella sp. XN79A]